MTATLLTVASLTALADDPGIRIEEVLDTTQTLGRQPIEVPPHARLKMSRYTLAPGASFPIHRHPYPRYGYVMSGELEVTLLDGHKTQRFKIGEAFAEVVEGWHTGKNVGKIPTVVLVIDQTPLDLDDNTSLRTRPKK